MNSQYLLLDKIVCTALVQISSKALSFMIISQFIEKVNNDFTVSYH